MTDLGVLGLGIGAGNLILSMARRGFSVAAFDDDAARVVAVRGDTTRWPVCAVETLADFIRELRIPRTIMLMVPAGASVDAAICGLLPLLSPGDLIVDLADSHFHETDDRSTAVRERGLEYIGVGISACDDGSRYAPSFMSGGAREAFERVRLAFEAVAARVDGRPCVRWCGMGSAGHYVKMIHDGIRCALLELLAEACVILRRGLGMADDELGDAFDAWNRTELSSYLVKIIAGSYKLDGDAARNKLFDIVQDIQQKRTGLWASQEFLELQVPRERTSATWGVARRVGRGQRRVGAFNRGAGLAEGLRCEAAG